MTIHRNCIVFMMLEASFFKNLDSEKISRIIEKLPNMKNVANVVKLGENGDVV